jgi:hypothetical protein
MKAKKNMYPGGGMLRNKYAQGGAVYGFGMSRGQGAAALASRPSVKPSSPVSRDMVMKFNPKNLDPRKMADLFTTTGGGPIDKVTDIMLKSGMPIRYGDRFLTSSNRGAIFNYSDVTETPMLPGESRPTATTPTTAKTTTATPTKATPPTAKTAGASVSFSKAFADARAKGLKEFTWNGKKYTTQIKGVGTEKPQATRNAEPVSKMPMKAVTSISKPYFESPTVVMQPASVKTAEMRGAPIQKMPVKQATSVQQSQPKAMATTDNKKTGYFKPGTMAEYLEERKRKMQSNLMAKK